MTFWKNFLKIQRDKRVIKEHKLFRNIAPDASILVQNSPKSLAAGAPPQTPLGELTAPPDPLAVMGWDRDLVTSFVGGLFVPPCS